MTEQIGDFAVASRPYENFKSTGLAGSGLVDLATLLDCRNLNGPSKSEHLPDCQFFDSKLLGDVTTNQVKDTTRGDASAKVADSKNPRSERTVSKDGVVTDWVDKKNYKMTWPDGHTVVQDGDTRTTTFKEGHSEVVTADGTITRKNLDGSVAVTRKDGTTELTESDGTKINRTKDGTITIKRPDGSSERQIPDGKGGYSKRGYGERPEQNFQETYDSKDGITRRTDSAGTSTTRFPDGTTRVERKDGTGFERKLNGVERHWGPKESDNVEKLPDTKRLIEERSRLRESAEKNIPKGQREEFFKNMDEFERRAQQQGLSPDEVAKTYEQTSRLLNAKDGRVNAESRVRLAQNIMHHAADPENISQGEQGTCSVTTLAERTFTRQPSKAAEMIASTALTGEWRAPDGKMIKIDDKSMVPDDMERVHPPADGDRSHATRIMNLVLTNDATQRRIPPQFYRQGERNGDDTGERLYDGSGPNAKLLQHKVQDKENPGKWVDEGARVALNDREISSIGKRLSGESDVHLTYGGENDGTMSFKTEEQMRAILKQMKDQRNLPIVVAVNGNMPPMKDSSGFGGHVVSITDYDPKTGRVRISNQWSKENDKWVDAKELYANVRTIDKVNRSK